MAKVTEQAGGQGAGILPGTQRSPGSSSRTLHSPEPPATPSALGQHHHCPQWAGSSCLLWVPPVLFLTLVNVTLAPITLRTQYLSVQLRNTRLSACSCLRSSGRFPGVPPLLPESSSSHSHLWSQNSSSLPTPVLVEIAHPHFTACFTGRIPLFPTFLPFSWFQHVLVVL